MTYQLYSSKEMILMRSFIARRKVRESEADELLLGTLLFDCIL